MGLRNASLEPGGSEVLYKLDKDVHEAGLRILNPAFLGGRVTKETHQN